MFRTFSAAVSCCDFSSLKLGSVFPIHSETARLWKGQNCQNIYSLSADSAFQKQKYVLYWIILIIIIIIIIYSLSADLQTKVCVYSQKQYFAGQDNVCGRLFRWHNDNNNNNNSNNNNNNYSGNTIFP